MPRPVLHRRWIALLSAACWLFAVGAALAQVDFQAGSLLESRWPSGPIENLPLPSVVREPAESFPLTPIEPGFAAQNTATQFAQFATTPDFAYHFTGKAR